jgi:hypothetical protein
MTVIHADSDLGYWARDYWRGHSQGLQVEDETRGLGIVEAVLGDEGEPEELVVRGGLFANRVYRTPVDAIREIDPRTKRIVVRMNR